MLLVLSMLAKNLFAMQVLQADNSQMAASLPRGGGRGRRSSQPLRGTIVDANGRPLVGTVTVFKMVACPPIRRRG